MSIFVTRLPEWNALVAAFPLHWKMLVRSAIAENVELTFVARSTTEEVLRRNCAVMGSPAIALVGDDPDLADARAVGPDHWPTAHFLSRWATAAFVHGAGAEPGLYAELPDTTRQAGGRLALVETNADHVITWGRLFARQGINVQLLIPTDGVHPVPPATGGGC